jgi:hypothetical protein
VYCILLVTICLVHRHFCFDCLSLCSRSPCTGSCSYSIHISILLRLPGERLNRLGFKRWWRLSSCQLTRLSILAFQLHFSIQSSLHTSLDITQDIYSSQYMAISGSVIVEKVQNLYDSETSLVKGGSRIRKASFGLHSIYFVE